MGIAFDARDNSLWVTDYEDDFVYHFSGEGNLHNSLRNLREGEVWNAQWDLQVTSGNTESYLVDVLFNSSYGNANISDNNTNDRLVDLLGDVTPPYFTDFANQTVYYNSSFSYDINATDAISFGYFKIDDNVNFTINSTTGIISNVTGLSVGYYQVNVSINDTAGNQNSDLLGLTVSMVLEIIPPNISFVTPTPADDTTTTNLSQEINVSITESDLDEFKWNWNGTNFTIYNDSLVLMMNFDNLSALGENDTLVKDLSGNGNDGTGYNGTTWTASGKYDGGFEFDGVDDWISAGESFWDGATYNKTYAGWVNIKGSTGSPWGVIEGNSIITKGGGYPAGFNIVVNDSNKQIAFTSNFNKIYSTGSVNYNEWHHIAVVTRDSNVTFYIDGNYSGSESYTYASDNDYELRIGCLDADPDKNFFNGTIDEVRIYNRSLSESEIQTLYMSNLNKYDADKWAFYINQTLNSTDLLTGGNYTYFASATDTSGNENMTEIRSLEISGDSSCQELSTPNSVYTLENNVSSTGTCFTITAENVTLDCDGYMINFSISGSSSQYGVYSNQNYTKIQNCILEEGNASGFGTEGILFAGVNFGELINNNVSIYSEASDGIFLSSSSYNNLTSNTGTSTSIMSWGIALYSSSYNNLTSNTGTSNSEEGIILYSSSNYNTLTNNIAISETDMAIQIQFSDYNSIRGLNASVTDETDRAIYLYNSSQNNFTDCVYLNAGTDVYSLGTERVVTNYMTNCSYDTETVSTNSSLIRKWYVETIVNDSNGFLTGADVNITNSSSVIVFSKLTNSSGATTPYRYEAIEYTRNETGKYYSTPHIVNVSKTGYEANSTSYNLTATNNVKRWVILSNETISPSANKFVITNLTGDNVASIDDKGYMYLRGTKNENQGVLNLESNSFVIKNSSENVVAYVSNFGSLYLFGSVTQSSDLSGRTSGNLEFRNSTNDLVAFFDNLGNLKLKGNLYENYDTP